LVPRLIVSISAELETVNKSVKVEVALENPEIFALPLTSRTSVGIVVPIPTRPVEQRLNYRRLLEHHYEN